MSTWKPVDGYEIAFFNDAYHIMRRGGDFYTEEPAWRVLCTFGKGDRIEAFRTRDLLRRTIEGSTA